MLLALEESAARTRSATHPARRSSAHPPDVPRQPEALLHEDPTGVRRFGLHFS